MEFHYHRRLAFSLLVRLGFLGVSIADEREDQTVHARRRFDNVRDVIALRQTIRIFGGLLLRGFFGYTHFGEIAFAVFVIATPQIVLLLFWQLAPCVAKFVIKHAHRLAGKSLVLRQIKITARGDAFKFLTLQLAVLVALAEREFEQNVHACAGVMRQFLRRLPMKTERLSREADTFVKAHALLDPVLMPCLPAPIRLRLAG